MKSLKQNSWIVALILLVVASGLPSRAFADPSSTEALARVQKLEERAALTASQIRGIPQKFFDYFLPRLSALPYAGENKGSEPGAALAQKKQYWEETLGALMDAEQKQGEFDRGTLPQSFQNLDIEQAVKPVCESLARMRAIRHAEGVANKVLEDIRRDEQIAKSNFKNTGEVQAYVDSKAEFLEGIAKNRFKPSACGAAQ